MQQAAPQQYVKRWAKHSTSRSMMSTCCSISDQGSCKSKTSRQVVTRWLLKQELLYPNILRRLHTAAAECYQKLDEGHSACSRMPAHVY